MKHLVELRTVEDALFRCSLYLDVISLVVHDEVQIRFGSGIFLVVEIELNGLIGSSIFRTQNSTRPFLCKGPLFPELGGQFVRFSYFGP